MTIEAPVRPSTNTQLGSRGEYYNLRAAPEHGLSKTELAQHKPLQKTVDVLLQTLEGNSPLYERKTPFKVNEWDNTYIPANNSQPRFFTVDESGKRIEEVDKEKVQRTPTYAQVGNDIVPVTIVGTKKGVQHWEVQTSGKPVMGPDQKPKIIIPDAVYPSRLVDVETGQAVKEYTERLIIRDELEDWTAFLCQDLLRGSDPGNHEEQWKEIREIASGMVALLNHPDAHIQAVQKSHLVNTAIAGIKIAKAAISGIPLDFKIETGFGASDSPFTSNRFVSYGIPALQLASSIQDYFDQRQANNQRVPERKPVVEFIFAQEAGKAVNFENNHDAVDARTEGNIAALQKLATECFPQVSVAFRKDLPWSNHSPFIRKYIDYLQDKIMKDPDPKVQQTLVDLVSFGKKHGDTHSDASTAARYAAAHPPVFGYQPQDFRAPDYYDADPRPQTNPDEIILVIGGRTERHFNGLIEAALGNCTRAGMMEYLQGVHSDEASIVQSELAQASLPNPNQVIIGVLHELNESGPAYFVHKIDRPEGFSRNDQIDHLTGRVGRLTERISTITGNMSKKEAGEHIGLAKLVERRFILAGKIKDLKTIADVYIRAHLTHGQI